MKKRLVLILLLSIFLFPFISAEGCELSVTLVNQDPYPAIPNDYFKIVFQVNGVHDSACKNMVFEIIEKFPFTVQGETKYTLKKNTYVYDYKTDWMIPYTLEVDKNALDGNSELTVKYYQQASDTQFTEKFNISIEDSRADFEIHVKDYDYKTKELTIEILNIADVDVEALTLEIPKQDNIDIKGANRIVVGDLDSNEYSSADFDAVIDDGSIEITIIYTDQIGIRRSITKTIAFDSNYFTARLGDAQQTSFYYYIIVIIIIALVTWWIIKKSKKKKERILKRRGEVRF